METNDKNENQNSTSPAKIFQVTKMSSSGISTTNTITTASSSNSQPVNVNNNNQSTSTPKSSGISKFNNFIRQLFETNEQHEASTKNNNSNNIKTDSKLKQKHSVSSKTDIKEELNELKSINQETITISPSTPPSTTTTTKIATLAISFANNKNENELNESIETPSKIKSKKELNLTLNRTLSDSVLERKSAVYSFNHHNSNNNNHNHLPVSRKDYFLSRKNSSNRRSIYAGVALNNSFSPVHHSKKNSLFLSTSPSPLSFTSPSSSGKHASSMRANLNHHKSTCSIYHNNSPTTNDSPRRICDNLLDLNHQKNNIKLNIERDQMNIKRISSLLSVSSASAESPIIVKKKLINAISIGPPQQPSCSSQTKTVLNNNEKSSSPVVFQSNDARRWSFASSSGYGTNTPINTMEENNNNQKNTNNSNSSQHSSNDLLSISFRQHNTKLPSNLCLDQSLSNSSQQQQPIEIHLTPQSAKIIDYDAFQFHSNKRSRINSSNEESSQLDDSSEAGFSPSISFHRQRARSLSCSPAKEYNDSDIIIIQNETFKDKFPKACSQMEEKLEFFVDSNKDLIDVGQCHQLDPAARFVHNQVIELAKLCLEKSKANQLNSDYFDEITNTLERLIQDAKEKFINVDTSLEHLRKLIRSFLLIISRVARLLECIEFDPLKFCYILDAAEEQAKNELTKADIPKYVISKLGLNRDPYEDIQKLGLNDEESDSSLTNNKNDINSIKSPSLKNSICTPSQADFEEIKLISNGAYGAVYLGKHRQTGERYAIKKIKKHNLLLRNQLQQVFTERDIMIFSDNPFVVAMICSFETKSHLCMVMEYVEGGDVATLIKNMGPLPLDMARTYFAETTLAVEYLHNYGIIHRDLKPDNLLITSLGHIKLTDFGLSKIGLMNLTTNFYEGSSDFMKDHYCKEFDDKQIYGTPQYLAPEVILRQRYGKAVDWWSMGVILYEFLTSFAPFNGNTPDELFNSVLNDEIMWPDKDDPVIQMPDDTRSLINGLLTHDPVKRLGAGGAIEIKAHTFFNNLDWDNLLIIKTDFVPLLDGPEDTSYFDSRLERYNHELDNSSEIKTHDELLHNLINKSSSNSIKPAAGAANELSDLLARNLKLEYHHQNDDSDLLINDDTDNELFASFSSCSSKFRLSSVSTTNSPVFMNEQNKMNTNQSLLTSQNTNNNANNSLILSHQNSQESFSGFLNKLPKEKYFAEISSDEETNNVINLNNKNKKRDTSNELAKTSNEILNDNNQTITSTIQSKLFEVLENKLKNDQSAPVTASKDSSNQSFKLFKRKQRKSTNTSKNNNTNQESMTKTQSQNELQQIDSTIIPTNTERIRRDSSSINILDSENTFKPISQTNSTYKLQNELSNNSSKKNLLSIPNNHNRKESTNKTTNATKQQNKNRLLKEMSQIASNRPTLTIKRGNRGFGFTLRSIKVFYGKTDLYIIEHLVIQIDEQGPAFQAGLRMNDLILNVNDELVCGKMHPEIVKLIMASKDNLLRLKTVPLSETNIRNRPVQNNNNFYRQDNHHIKRHQSSSIKVKEYTLYPTKSSSNEKNYYFENNESNQENLSNNLYPTSSGNKLGYSLVERKKKKTLLRKLSEKRAQKYAPNELPSYKHILHQQSNSSSSSSSLNNSPSITIRKPSKIVTTTDVNSGGSGCNSGSGGCLSPSDSIKSDKSMDNFSRRNMSTSDLTSCLISTSKSCLDQTNNSINNGSNTKLNKLESTFKKFSISNLYQPSSSPSLTNLSGSNKNNNNNDDDVFVNTNENNSSPNTNN